MGRGKVKKKKETWSMHYRRSIIGIPLKTAKKVIPLSLMPALCLVCFVSFVFCLNICSSPSFLLRRTVLPLLPTFKVPQPVQSLAVDA